jgi:hypothetical protein
MRYAPVCRPLHRGQRVLRPQANALPPFQTPLQLPNPIPRTTVYMQGCATPLCVGRSIEDNEFRGHKLVHTSSGNVCGGHLGKAALCGKKVGAWQNFMITMSG